MRYDKVPLSGRIRLLGVTAVIAFCVILGVPLLESSNSMGATHGSRGTVQAQVARSEGVNQSIVLRVTKIQGSTIDAQGQSSKEPIDGNIAFYLTLSNASKAKATFTGSNSHGSVRGSGNASYHVAGGISYFSGTVSSLTGTGRYSHARSLGIKFSGTLNRQTFKVSMALHGSWSH
jgi:hypothetical protein